MQTFEREKVLYEISMSIGNTLDMELMCKDFLSTLSKKLALSSVAIIENSQDISFQNVVFSIPKRIKKNQDYINSFDDISTTKFEILTMLETKVRYIFKLEGFGYIIMFSNQVIEPLIIKSLGPLFKKVVVALISCIDHMKLKQNLIDAEKAGDAKMQFLATMSHEIRTPMNGISGFVQLLQRTKTDEKQKKYLNIVQSSIDTLTNVINEILDFSKLEGNSVELEFIDTNPFENLYTALLIHEAKAKENKINYCINIDENIFPLLSMSAQHIKQVMSNLISNAIKFTPEGGNVTIGLKLLEEFNDTQKILFQVQDTGIGIPLERQEHIFEPFTQADSSTTRKYGGTGLGLSISVSLVKLMGSKLELESCPNIGTTFFFTLELSKVQ